MKGDVLSDVLQRVRGEISSVVYENEDNGYSVVRIKDKQGREITLTGALSGAAKGLSLEAEGVWEKHKKHGLQFKISNFSFTLPVTEEGIKRYLASGIIKGIGPKTASAIVEYFGLDTLNILDNYSARLTEVDGIGKGTRKKIKEAWDSHTERRSLYLYMQSLGISPAYCRRIYKEYGAKASDILRKNPYELAEKVRGIGFLMADRIASSMDIYGNDIRRISSGIKFALSEKVRDGHVCYPLKELIEYASEILSAEKTVLEDVLRTLLKNKKLRIQKNPNTLEKLLYLPDMLSDEKSLAQFVKKRTDRKLKYGRKLAGISGISDFELNDQQKKAVMNACRYSFSVITGGPGVGKTTVVGEIVSRAEKLNLKIKLVAPTGRAAKRMAETTGIKASTIHRLLQWDPQTSSFVHNEHRPVNCDIMIVDEVSDRKSVV